MLDRPGALEDEIALLIVEWAERRAHELFAASGPPPIGDDLYSRAVRGVHGRLTRQKEAADEAEKLRRYRETDDLLRRMKAGEEID